MCSPNESIAEGIWEEPVPASDQQLPYFERIPISQTPVGASGEVAVLVGRSAPSPPGLKNYMNPPRERERDAIEIM